jgi:metal-responsive CopG/Arc/MetJ family transcriptional regulator
MSQYPQINVRVDEEFLKRLDDWRRKQPDLPGRPEAIRRIVDQALAQREPKTRKR